MRFKMKLKMGIDFLMMVLLILLMAYQVTGEALHEYIGAGMLILFLLHNFLNIRWYGALAKGKYSALRILRTVVNLFCLIAMLVQTYSGIVLSHHVFAVLPINGGMATARVMHLTGSYWGFVLMSIHLGLHWSMITGMFHKLSGGRMPEAIIWIVRLLAVGIAVYGAVCFYQADMVSYMFLKVEFAFLDYEKSRGLILAEYLSIMGLWVFLSYYLSKALGQASAVSKSKQRERKL